ncbi:MAG: HAD family hydrolase [Candidatus Lokiarchaeota archaeon]|nr:HAD family hydrolase [Candidatus Lokiarchaeota archaeon]
MKVKGVIFDFGFTLFSFENPSVEKYLDCFRRGMSKSIKVLKQEKIIEDNDQILKDFKTIFNKKRATYFKLAMKTKDEFPTTLLFKTALDLLKEKGYEIQEEKLKEKFLEKLADLYHSCEEEEWKPDDKTNFTLEMLSKISNLKIGLISNHPNHKTIKNMLINNEMKEYFDVIVTSAKFGKRKPIPDIFFHTLKRMGLTKNDAEHCIMVGDEAADIVGANKVGMQIILKERTYEFPYEKEIKIPNLITIKSIDEVLQYIN